MPKTWPRCLPDIPKISPRYPPEILQISQRYPLYIPNISPIYPKYIPYISPRYPQDIPKNIPRYTPRYSSDPPDIPQIFTKAQGNINDDNEMMISSAENMLEGGMATKTLVATTIARAMTGWQ